MIITVVRKAAIAEGSLTANSPIPKNF